MRRSSSACVPGVYVAGDASRREQYAIVSAAEGAPDATAINQALTREELAAAGEMLQPPGLRRPFNRLARRDLPRRTHRRRHDPAPCR